MAPMYINSRTPCAAPIDTLDTLLSWEKSDDYYVGVADLEPCHRLANQPKTLVCHDMAGGYLEDRFVQGSGKYDAYRFYHWHLVDTFVYFSHHMITIPPPCWINAAHKHGVPVLGTFITEWEDGFEKCKQLLSDMTLMHKVINKMVDIATHHSMDGWLINIENKIEKHRIDDLVVFVNILTERMHNANPKSQVIWYDSVTIEGDLEWQNELNENNRDFFDACDAIFLNYTWNTENLGNSAKNSRGRLQDVYVGIDVFGRGMIGGGGYNTKEPMALARKAQLSVALFAPGWVYEVNGSREFSANEESVFRFWYYLQPYLPMHVRCKLPLASSFCQGWGQRLYMDGEVVSDEPWSNLSMQQLQPTLTHSELGHNPHHQTKWLLLQDGFLGGGAMQFRGKLPNTGQALTYRIFDTSIQLESSVYVSYTMKCLPMKEGANLYLYLTLNKGELDEERILLPEEDVVTNVYTHGDNDTVIDSVIADEVPKGLRKSNCGRENGQWKNKVFLLGEDLLKAKRLDEIGMLAHTNNVDPMNLDVLVGTVQVLDVTDETLRPESLERVVTDEVSIEPIDKTIYPKLPFAYSLSMKLQWTIPSQDVTAYHIWYKRSGEDRQWLGCTYSNKYFISEIHLEDQHGDIEFTVQTLYKSGVLEPLNQAKTRQFIF